MKRTDVALELKSRLSADLNSILNAKDRLQKFAEVPTEKLINQFQREIDIIDQIVDTKTFITLEDFLEYIKDRANVLVKLETATGKQLEFMVDPAEVHIPSALEKFAKKEHGESDPAILNQWGIYLTPPHGELFWRGKKTAMVKSIELKQHLEEPIYLLSGKLCYGIIEISKPKKIGLSEFKQLADKHTITNSERVKWWPKATELYYYPVRFIRRWDPPREWKVQKGAQIFVRDVKFEEETDSARFIFESKPEYREDEPTREEAVAEELEHYGDWYKVKANPKKQYRYAAQQHIRGNSVHTDLRMEANDHLIGWTLDTPGNKTQSSKFLKPLSPSQGTDYQILAEQKLIQPKVWLTVKGKIEPGGIGATKYKEAEFEIVSSGRVKFGVQKHDFHEYFLIPDKKWAQDKTIAGRWVVAYIPRPQHYTRAGEGKMMHAMFKPNDQRPYVEYQDYDESVEKAKKEKGYAVWQHPDKGIEKETVDFRENKKPSWIYK